jgi:hypothetical protein
LGPNNSKSNNNNCYDIIIGVLFVFYITYMILYITRLKQYYLLKPLSSRTIMFASGAGVHRLQKLHLDNWTHKYYLETTLRTFAALIVIIIFCNDIHFCCLCIVLQSKSNTVMSWTWPKLVELTWDLICALHLMVFHRRSAKESFSISNVSIRLEFFNF